MSDSCSITLTAQSYNILKATSTESPGLFSTTLFWIRPRFDEDCYGHFYGPLKAVDVCLRDFLFMSYCCFGTIVKLLKGERGFWVPFWICTGEFVPEKMLCSSQTLLQTLCLPMMVLLTGSGRAEACQYGWWLWWRNMRWMHVSWNVFLSDILSISVIMQHCCLLLLAA